MPLTSLNRFYHLLLLGCLLGFHPLSHALSLSAIELNSGLNEVLEARVPIASANAQELENLRISIRQDDPYSAIQRHHTFRAALVADPEGAHFLLIKSDKPIKEPLLSFTLELNWSSGRLNRQYELLIDPT